MFRINFNRKISLTQVISKSLLRLMREAGGASTGRLDGATAASICRTQNPEPQSFWECKISSQVMTPVQIACHSHHQERSEIGLLKSMLFVARSKKDLK